MYTIFETKNTLKIVDFMLYLSIILFNGEGDI